MSGWEDNSEQPMDALDMIKKQEEDALMLAKAYQNSYDVLTKKITFEDLMMSDFQDHNSTILAFDPDCGPKKSELENMIEFYIEDENYERCSELNKILKRMYP